MKLKFGIAVALLVLSVAAASVTFTRRGYMQRQIVDPTYPAYASDAVETRGWPWAFVADDPSQPHFRSIGREDRFFAREFLYDVAFFFVAFGLAIICIWTLVKRLSMRSSELPPASAAGSRSP